MSLQFENYFLYSNWESALVNGDYSGLSDTETQELDEWVASEMASNGWASFHCVDVSEPSKFMKPDSGQGLVGDCCKFTFQVRA